MLYSAYTMKLFFIAKFFIPLAFITTLLCGLVYVSSQQILRQSANDPQIQIAEDLVLHLDMGESPENLVGSHKIDISRSLSTFVILYAISGKDILSTGDLNNKTPSLPVGVLNQARSTGENRLTWQPTEGVRIASVVVPYKNGYVLVGRSLREVEKREDQLLFITSFIYLISLIGSLGFISIFVILYPHKKQNR